MSGFWAQDLKIVFMKFHDHSERVLFPAFISVSSDSAHLLAQMAEEMEVSLDELLSGIAEDAVSELQKNSLTMNDVFIPDQCSREDLLKYLD